MNALTINQAFLYGINLLVIWYNCFQLKACTLKYQYSILFGSRFGIQDSGFKIRDSRLKNKNMKMYFKKKVPDFSISKYLFTRVLLQSFNFTQKFVLSYAGAVHENSLSVACCTFIILEVTKYI